MWCWLISGFGCYCIALSVAELVSAYPTSGGLYFTCKYLAPEAWVPEIAWLCGWLNLLGQIAGAASTEYGCAQLLLAAVSMSTDFTTYVPTDRQTVGVMAASTVFHGALNSLRTSALEKITKTYVIFHIAVLLACCITLLAMCNNESGQGLHTSAYVWTEVTNNSGWAPNGWSWLFGFLSASWTMTVRFPGAQHSSSLHSMASPSKIRESNSSDFNRITTQLRISLKKSKIPQSKPPGPLPSPWASLGSAGGCTPSFWHTQQAMYPTNSPRPWCNPWHRSSTRSSAAKAGSSSPCAHTSSSTSPP